ncbi:MAG TPA: response regulator transcription factor [Phycisphaerales bacterium]|nr:response regulator transcription factor [Phycisphaerales bacterium]
MNAQEMSEYTVLCVDDNPHVSDALRSMLHRTPNLRWIGTLPDATDLLERVESERPDIVILDLDMPGPDPFEVLATLSERCPDSKTIVFTGHVRRDYIDRAVEAGAWGYVSKNEAEDRLFEAIGQVLDGRFAFSPEVRATLDT